MLMYRGAKWETEGDGQVLIRKMYLTKVHAHVRVRSPLAMGHHLVVDVLAISAHFERSVHRLVPFSLPLEKVQFQLEKMTCYRSKNSVGVVAVPLRISPEELLGHLEEGVLSVEAVSEAHPVVVVEVVESVVVHPVVVAVVVVVAVEASGILVVIKSITSVGRSPHPVVTVEVVCWAHAVSVVVHPIALVVVMVHPLVVVEFVVSVVVVHPVVFITVDVSGILIVVESVASVERSSHPVVAVEVVSRAHVPLVVSAEPGLWPPLTVRVTLVVVTHLVAAPLKMKICI